jgi:hypothetical protein
VVSFLEVSESWRRKGKRFWVSFTDSPSYFVSDFLGVNNTLSDTLVSLISYFLPRFLRWYWDRKKILHVEVRGSQQKYHLGVISGLTWLCILNDTVSDTQFYPSKTCQHKAISIRLFWLRKVFLESEISLRRNSQTPNQARSLKHVTTQLVTSLQFVKCTTKHAFSDLIYLRICCEVLLV